MNFVMSITHIKAVHYLSYGIQSQEADVQKMPAPHNFWALPAALSKHNPECDAYLQLATARHTARVSEEREAPHSYPCWHPLET